MIQKNLSDICIIGAGMVGLSLALTASFAFAYYIIDNSSFFKT
jgi:flavin-dependent dehydrogenase